MVYLQLTAAQTFELRRLSQTAVGRVALRALMVLWRAEGHSTLEIAARLGCHRETVTPWVERYRQHGVPGLADPPKFAFPKARMTVADADAVHAYVIDQAWKAYRAEQEATHSRK